MPKSAIYKVLDFVERWNKNDAEADVAQAAQDIQTWLNASSLGSIRSKKKAEASRINGKKGGRPRKVSGSSNK